MANPSPRPLAEMMRSARRQYTALFMLLIIYLVGQVAGAFYLEDHPELPRGLWYFVGLGSSLPFMLFAIGYGIYGLVTGRFKRRAENVLVMKVGGEPAFVMPHTSGSQILLNAAGRSQRSNSASIRPHSSAAPMMSVWHSSSSSS